jgi:hypothetical protein
MEYITASIYIGLLTAKTFAFSQRECDLKESLCPKAITVVYAIV